ncbi:MAG: hypothetical protein HY552_06980 [Elusimicrobia bacterium]|nr:hypothetical protein [Elusimicrobiota bacterium]
MKRILNARRAAAAVLAAGFLLTAARPRAATFGLPRFPAMTQTLALEALADFLQSSDAAPTQAVLNACAFLGDLDSADVPAAGNALGAATAISAFRTAAAAIPRLTSRAEARANPAAAAKSVILHRLRRVLPLDARERAKLAANLRLVPPAARAELAAPFGTAQAMRHARQIAEALPIDKIDAQPDTAAGPRTGWRPEQTLRNMSAILEAYRNDPGQRAFIARGLEAAGIELDPNHGSSGEQPRTLRYVSLRDPRLIQLVKDMIEDGLLRALLDSWGIEEKLRLILFGGEVTLDVFRARDQGGPLAATIWRYANGQGEEYPVPLQPNGENDASIVTSIQEHFLREHALAKINALRPGVGRLLETSWFDPLGDDYYDAYFMLLALGYDVDVAAAGEDYMRRVDDARAARSFRREVRRDPGFFASQAPAGDAALDALAEQARKAYLQIVTALGVLARHPDRRLVSHNARSSQDHSRGPVGVITEEEFQRHYARRGYRLVVGKAKPSALLDGVLVRPEFLDLLRFVQGELGYRYDAAQAAWLPADVP